MNTKTKNFDELLKALNDSGDAADELSANLPDNIPADGEGVDGAPDPDAEDDEAIAAAAAEAEKNKKSGEVLGKSFAAVDADGNPIEAIDATELIKSLVGRQTATDEVLAKALTSVGLVIGKQSDLIKALSEQVKTLAASGRGRRTVLSVSEKPDIDTLAKSAAGGGKEEGMNPVEFFAKANAAFEGGRLTGLELNVINVSLRENQPIDEPLIRKVMG